MLALPLAPCIWKCLKAITRKVLFCLCYSLNQNSELHTKETINLESTLCPWCLFHPKVLYRQHILLQIPKTSQQRRTTAFVQYSYPWASSITEIFIEQEDLEIKKTALKSLGSFNNRSALQNRPPQAITTSHIHITRRERYHSPKSKSSKAHLSSGLFSRDPQPWNQNASRNAFSE